MEVGEGNVDQQIEDDVNIDRERELLKWCRLFTLGSSNLFYQSRSFDNDGFNANHVDNILSKKMIPFCNRLLSESRSVIDTALTNDTHKYVMNKVLLPQVVPLMRKWNYDPPSKANYYWLLATMWRCCDDEKMIGFIAKGNFKIALFLLLLRCVR